MKYFGKESEFSIFTKKDKLVQGVFMLTFMNALIIYRRRDGMMVSQRMADLYDGGYLFLFIDPIPNKEQFGHIDGMHITVNVKNPSTGDWIFTQRYVYRDVKWPNDEFKFATDDMLRRLAIKVSELIISGMENHPQMFFQNSSVLRNRLIGESHAHELIEAYLVSEYEKLIAPYSKSKYELTLRKGTTNAELNIQVPYFIVYNKLDREDHAVIAIGDPYDPANFYVSTEVSLQQALDTLATNGGPFMMSVQPCLLSLHITPRIIASPFVKY